MRAKSITGSEINEIQLALENALADGFKPTLAIIFCSVKTNWRSIRDILHEAGLDIFGASSSGEFVDGHQTMGAAAILLLDLPRDAYSVLFQDLRDRNLADVASQLASAALQTFNKPACILCSTGISLKGDLFPGNQLIQYLEEAIGPKVKIYGGMAGDDTTFSGTYVFTHDRETDIGLEALVLDENKISLHGMAISGWQPIGITRTVTKSEGGWLYEIDGQPALEMYLKFLGKDSVTSENRYNLYEEIGVHYPFQVSGIGDPTIRTPIMFDQEKDAIKLDFDIPVGATLRFSTPPDFDIVQNVLDKAKELKEATNTEAEALLIFSCAGRLNALGPLTTVENDGLAEIWNVPMAGFFTYGEYGTSSEGKQGFYSTTCCWVALKAKSPLSS